jgi:hypothetical protein
MRTFFIQVDVNQWHHHFLPAFLEHLEDAPDTVDHLMEIVSEYVQFRYEVTANIASGIVDGAQETPEEMTGLILSNENITYVDVSAFARLLNDFYQSIHGCLIECGPPEGVRDFVAHVKNETLFGFSGYQVLQ